MSLNESIVEDAALEWFGALGYAVGHGPHLAPGEPAAEPACVLHADRRGSFGEVVQSRVARTLTRPLPRGEERREAIRRLNPAIPEEARAVIGSFRIVQLTTERTMNP